MYNHKRVLELTVKELEMDLEEQKDKVTDANCIVELKHGLVMTLILAYKELYENPMKAILLKKQQAKEDVTVIKDDGREGFKFEGEEHEESNS